MKPIPHQNSPTFDWTGDASVPTCPIGRATSARLPTTRTYEWVGRTWAETFLGFVGMIKSTNHIAMDTPRNKSFLSLYSPWIFSHSQTISILLRYFMKNENRKAERHLVRAELLLFLDSLDSSEASLFMKLGVPQGHSRKIAESPLKSLWANVLCHYVLRSACKLTIFILNGIS